MNEVLLYLKTIRAMAQAQKNPPCSGWFSAPFYPYRRIACAVGVISPVRAVIGGLHPQNFQYDTGHFQKNQGKSRFTTSLPPVNAIESITDVGTDWVLAFPVQYTG